MVATHNGFAIDPALQFGVLLRCPRCAANTTYLECPICAFQMRVDEGVVQALPPERESHFARFAQDYQRIRFAEGRFSELEDFYLGLPYRDMTKRNSRQWQIRARSYNYLLRHVLKRNLSHGDFILDVGAGNCWMSYRLALAGYRPIAADLLANGRDGLRAARHYRKHLPDLFPLFRAEMERLPFQDEQFDAVIFNASFHYSEDYEATLREALRCVRKNGMVIVSDTPWYSRDESGRQMLAERRALFLKKYETSSHSIASQEYLTDERLRAMELSLSIRWELHSPNYGLKWAMRPLVAKWRRRREPSRFRIYVARKRA